MKKKFILCLLVLVSCFALVGCGCSREEYTVNFDTHGGSSIDSQTIKKGDKVEKPADPTRDGYSFDGWYLNLEDDTAYNFDDAVEKDFTLHAKWNDAACNVTCDEGYTLDEDTCECIDQTNGEQEGLTVNRTSLSLIVGGTAKITATVNPATETITFTSSNTKVVTVDQNGNVKAVSAGTAQITVTAGEWTKTVKVTVLTKSQATEQFFSNEVKPKMDNYVSKINNALGDDVGIKSVTFNDDTVGFNISDTSASVLDVASEGNITGFFNDFLGEDLNATSATYNIGSTKKVDLTKGVNSESLAKEILVYLAGGNKSAVDLTLGDIKNTKITITLTFNENGVSYSKPYTISFNG